jgi:hypothetical protein
MWTGGPAIYVSRMTTIRITNTSSLSPERVLFAARDFGKRRIEVWPAVRAEHLVVHDLADASADVTEGTPTGIGTNWERCRYDWSQPGIVVATVTDSNVYRVGASVWRIAATAIEGGGSRVEMTWVRRFRGTPRGLLFATVFRLLGRPVFAAYARDVIRNLERLESAEATSSGQDVKAVP